MNDIIYDGKSLNDLGFFVTTYPVHTVAQRDIKFTSVVSRNGDIITDNKRYKNVDMPPYQINSVPHFVRARDSRELEQALIDFAYCDGNYKVLRDTTVPGYFTYAVCSEVGELKTNSLNNYISTTLKFNRIPFWYSHKGQEKVVFDGNDIHILYNNEKLVSEPLIRIYGQGSLVLIINNINYFINIPEAYDYVDLDTELQSVFRGSNNLSNIIAFDYMPVLLPGNNTIRCTAYASSTAHVEKIEITPRWRRL